MILPLSEQTHLHNTRRLYYLKMEMRNLKTSKIYL